MFSENSEPGFSSKGHSSEEGPPWGVGGEEGPGELEMGPEERKTGPGKWGTVGKH